MVSAANAIQSAINVNTLPRPFPKSAKNALRTRAEKKIMRKIIHTPLGVPIPWGSPPARNQANFPKNPAKIAQAPTIKDAIPARSCQSWDGTSYQWRFIRIPAKTIIDAGIRNRTAVAMYT